MAIEKGTNFALFLGAEKEVTPSAWLGTGVVTVPSVTPAYANGEIVPIRLGNTGGYANLDDQRIYFGTFASGGTSVTVRKGPGGTDPVVDPGGGGTIGDVRIVLVRELTMKILPGQENTEFALSGETVDTTDKSQEGWESKLRATKRVSVSASGFVRWPDTDGVNQLRTRFLTTANNEGFILARVRERGKAESGLPGYDGLFMIEELNLSAGSKDVTRYSVSLGSVGEVHYRT